MSKGLLEVHGTLSVQQFWPRGTSDADTAHVALDKFLFGPSASKLKVTKVFAAAVVKRSEGAKTEQGALLQPTNARRAEGPRSRGLASIG